MLSSSAVPYLQIRSLSKIFGALRANDQIDLDIFGGEIHAILGENGAGKSTLMKMLYGIYVPDEGQTIINGQDIALHPPIQARKQGIHMVFQDFRLVPALTVLENIMLAAEQTGFFFKKKSLKKKLDYLMERYQIFTDPDAYVWELDLGQRQRVEILKVLLHENAKLFIFDEPTSVLTQGEVDSFLKMLVRLKEDGYAVLLITHKIDEVIACADKVTVLTAGKVVYSKSKAEGFLKEELIRQMMGDKKIQTLNQRSYSASHHPIVDIRHGSVADDRKREVLIDIHLQIHEGEILGIAGISGNGQRELAEVLFGSRKLSKGEILIDQENMTEKSPKAFLEKGLAFVTENPIKESVVPGFTIIQHMVLSGLPFIHKGFGIHWEALHQKFQQHPVVQTLKVQSPASRVDQLSGGNLQRMLLSRAIMRNPKILIVSYPSRGLDFGTTQSIHQILLSLREKGTAIVLISEDLNELFDLSDRLIILGNRTIYGPFDPQHSDHYTIGNIMLKGETA